MEWTPKKIYKLRKTLNWTRDQLSRRLSCSLKLVAQIEHGEVEISTELMSQLDQLQKQTDFVFEQKNSQPHAEKLMKEQGLSQISKELIDELKEKE